MAGQNNAAELVPTTSAMRRALRRAEDGVGLDVSEATVLLAARGADLDRLLAAAAAVRDQGLSALGRPGVVTYSRKVFIPLTRLCRDRCHYCTFATTPGRLDAPYLELDEVVRIAKEGAALGCKEALLTLGDRPEDRWAVARQWLDARGYDDTLAYVRAAAISILEQTGLLPHLNPGVLTWQDFQRLKPVAPSMGMMLETTSRALFELPGGAHFGSPDKDPSVRLRVLEDAGRSAVPFTTGILVGIGETRADRAESVHAIRRVARQYGSIQEVIIQNFRAKPDTAMRTHPDVELADYLAAVAVTRLVLGPTMRIQAPPNLVDPTELELLLRAGVDDWGGVSPLTPDHVNPERPWPHLEELTARTAAAGFALRERLTAHPSYVLAREPWLDPRVVPHVEALRDLDGLGVEGRCPTGLPWQEPDRALESTGRVDLNDTVDTTGRRAGRRTDFDEVYGDWQVLREQVGRVRAPKASGVPTRIGADLKFALRHAQEDPAGISDAEALTLFSADGPALTALTALADDVRKDAVGDEVTFVVNRNINFTNVCYTGCRFCAFAQRRTDADAYTLSVAEVGTRAQEAWDVGATEVCMQGGIHPDLPGSAYWDLAAEIRRRTPAMHLHAFSPMEVVNGASRTGLSIRDWLQRALESGLNSIPGTAAEILDDDVRWVLTKGKLPTASWVEVVTTAHRLGIPTTSTMMYGHVDAPHHWVAHLRLLASIQDQTGGFTEFVPLPFIHTQAPVYLAGVARPGPTRQENRAVHAMARLLLHGRIANIQCSWVKLGVVGCREVLEGGVNDLGGTLMEETISRMAGSEHGSRKSVAELEDLVAPLGRPVRQRSTTYGEVSAERLAAARRRTVNDEVTIGSLTEPLARSGTPRAPVLLPVPPIPA